MTGKGEETSAQDAPGGGRRQGNRRVTDAGYTGPERRKHERRSGEDRRTNPRDDGSDGANKVAGGASPDTPPAQTP